MTRSTTIAAPPAARVLATSEWKERAAVHRTRADRWTRPYRQRRSRQEKHPIHDFLFQYYMYSPAKLERWHPAPGEALADSPEARERFNGRAYRVEGGLADGFDPVADVEGSRKVDGPSTRGPGTAEWVLIRDPARMTESERTRLRTTAQNLAAVESRPPNFGCFGMHEWAMVYQGHDVRHEGTTSLRLPQDEIDRFVEDRPIACSHFDAFRFFADEARPLNRIDVTPATRHDLEQPGCIHANMDLYRWAYTSMPWVGSDLVMDCFELAMDLRVLDMQASPYDLVAMGFEPVRIETDAGRAEYQRRQRALAERASLLRTRLIEVLATLSDESSSALDPRA